MPRKIKIDSANQLTIQEGYGEFVRSLKVRNCSSYTMKFYENIISRFGQFHGLDNPLVYINSRLIEDYVLQLREEGLAGKTINSYITGIRTILYFFMKQEFIDDFKIQAPKYEKSIKETYSDEQLKKLLVRPKKTCTFTDFRDWTLICFLIATGIRLNTICNIKIGDLNLNEGIIVLQVVKNRKPTILPLSSTIVNTLREYLRMRRGTEDDYLFCNATGGQFSRRGIEDAVKFYNRSRGVTLTGVHAFRHTFAKKYLLAGGDIFRLQRLMCHQDLDSTKVYLDMCLVDLQKEYDNFNPLENLAKDSSPIKIQ